MTDELELIKQSPSSRPSLPRHPLLSTLSFAFPVVSVPSITVGSDPPTFISTVKPGFRNFQKMCTKNVSEVQSHCFNSRNMRPLNMKLRGNVYEGSLSTVFLAELNLMTSFSIYKS